MSTKKPIINVNCDFVVSRFCRKTYEINKYAYAQNLSKNNGKFRCKLCAIEQTHKGEKSHYFKYNKNENYFSVIDTDVKAYLLGVLAGDGCITYKVVNLVANSKDIETIHKFVKEIYIDDSPKLTKNGNCYAVSITSEKLAKDICGHLDILPGKKSDKITLPNLDKNLLWAFIRGLFDTDGCVSSIYAKTTSPSCYYSSTSAKILHQIQKICVDEGISCHITGIKLKFSGMNAIKFMQKIYDDTPNALTRKKEMFKLWQTWAPRKGHAFIKYGKQQ